MSATAPRSNFDDFLSRALLNVETRNAYEDAQERHRVIDTLVRLRTRLGMTQTAVAKFMGVRQPTVSGFETEGSDPRLSTLQRYARAVDASLWIQVQPNTASNVRVDYHFLDDSLARNRAAHSETTERAGRWAMTGERRYRHLRAVPA